MRKNILKMWLLGWIIWWLNSNSNNFASGTICFAIAFRFAWDLSPAVAFQRWQEAIWILTELGYLLIRSVNGETVYHLSYMDFDKNSHSIFVISWYLYWRPLCKYYAVDLFFRRWQLQSTSHLHSCYSRANESEPTINKSMQLRPRQRIFSSETEW